MEAESPSQEGEFEVLSPGLASLKCPPGAEGWVILHTLWGGGWAGLGCRQCTGPPLGTRCCSAALSAPGFL